MFGRIPSNFTWARPSSPHWRQPACFADQKSRACSAGPVLRLIIRYYGANATRLKLRGLLASIGFVAIWSCFYIPFAVGFCYATELHRNVMRLSEDVSVIRPELEQSRTASLFQGGDYLCHEGFKLNFADSCNFNIAANEYLRHLASVHRYTSRFIWEFPQKSNKVCAYAVSRGLADILDNKSQAQSCFVNFHRWPSNCQIGAQLFLSGISSDINGILSGFGGLLGGLDQAFSILPGGLHFIKLTSHGIPLKARDYSAGSGYDRQNNGEYAYVASPSRHRPFIFIVIGLSFLCLGGVAMVLAFKSAEKADDYGFTWWWCPLVLFLLLSLFLMGQGLRFLGRYDDGLESKAVYTSANSNALAAFPKTGGAI
jgi:hypothetical protein